MQCIKCGQDTQGYKCNICGAESSEHDDKHGLSDDGRPKADHPRGAEHCMSKCVGCGQAEVNCPC